MWRKIAKIALGLLLEYVAGSVFAVISFIITFLICAVFFKGTSSCIGSMRFPLGMALVIGIPIGAVLGIFLVDKFILGVAVLKRQTITGLIAGVTASVSLVILYFCGMKILPEQDGPSGLIGRVSIFYIVTALVALLGYTIASLTKRNTSKEVNSQKGQESS